MLVDRSSDRRLGRPRHELEVSPFGPSTGPLIDVVVGGGGAAAAAAPLAVLAVPAVALSHGVNCMSRILRWGRSRRRRRRRRFSTIDKTSWTHIISRRIIQIEVHI